MVAGAGAFLLGFSITAFSAPAERFDARVREKFFAGFAGDKAALADAMKMCDDVLAANPEHAEALVWHGSGIFMRAGDAFRSGDVQSGMALMRQSNEEMDRAVAMQPDRIAVRAPRGAVLLTGSRFLPPEMAKPLLDRGLDDYERVLELQSAHFDQVGEHPKGELLFGLAEGWSRAGETPRAAAYFNRILKELPGTPYAKRAAKWLDTKSLDRTETGCIGCHVRK